MTKQEKIVSAIYWTIATVGIGGVYLYDRTAISDVVNASIFAASLYFVAVLISWYRKRKGIK